MARSRDEWLQGASGDYTDATGSRFFSHKGSEEIFVDAVDGTTRLPRPNRFDRQVNPQLASYQVPPVFMPAIDYGFHMLQVGATEYQLEILMDDFAEVSGLDYEAREDYWDRNVPRGQLNEILPTKGSQYGLANGGANIINPLTDTSGVSRGPIIAMKSMGQSDLAEIPTATSNFERPRTVAAAYSPQVATLTIIFRDGTFYNYYEVTKEEWEGFRAQPSKGDYIKSVLDAKKRGPADMSRFPEEVREILYRAYRTAQYRFGGSLMPSNKAFYTKKGTLKKRVPTALQPHVKTYNKGRSPKIRKK